MIFPWCFFFFSQHKHTHARTISVPDLEAAVTTSRIFRNFPVDSRHSTQWKSLGLVLLEGRYTRLSHYFEDLLRHTIAGGKFGVLFFLVQITSRYPVVVVVVTGPYPFPRNCGPMSENRNNIN
uniref:(northern house mosquito) hypothetical protein n=1 Tax=Culex pipiens TaxID=7175 RepID=A0A8D8BUH5_CULPI